MIKSSTQFLAAYPSLSPICAEALANYIYNQKNVAREIYHPGGEVECQGPPQPEFSLAACDTSRLLYQAEAWYDQMSRHLQRSQGDWESPLPGTFSYVERNEESGETTYWIVRDVAQESLSVWSLLIEKHGKRSQCTTFVVPNAASQTKSATGETSPNGRDRSQRVLAQTHRAYLQRAYRILHLLQHLHALGMRSTQEYRIWCTRRNLSPDLHKTAQQRRQELHLVRAPGAAESQNVSDWFAKSLARICEGETSEADLRTEYLQKIARAFAGGLAGGARRAYMDLLLHVEKCANLFGLEPAMAYLGPQTGNTFIEGLAALARHYRRWLRSVAEWQPETHNPQRQFSALVRHLTTRYEVPEFMDTAWLRGRDATAQQQQSWFLHLAAGQNMRTADVPVNLSKKMAHQFLQAPAHYTIEEALRWGQIMGQGGDEALVEAVNATPLGTSFDNEKFWATAIHFLVENPMLDPDFVAPIIDYIHHRKYAPQEIVHPGGEVEIADPPEPNFSMKSRSVPKLLDQVETWHTQLTREVRSPAVQWDKSPIADFSHKEKDTENGGFLHWTIRELLNKKEMQTEGRELRHCAASYAGNCKLGKTSVWSLQVTNSLGENFRLATIAVDPRTRNVTQLRGKFNLKPVMSTRGVTFRSGLEEKYALYLYRVRDILRLWVRQENLGKRGDDLGSWLH